MSGSGAAPAVGGATSLVLGAVPDPSALARSLAKTGRDWFWFDGTAAAPGEPRMSYLGTAATAVSAEPGREREFLSRFVQAPARGDHASGFCSGWVVALGYEFGLGLLGVDAPGDAVAPAIALRVDALVAIDHDAGIAEVRGASHAAVTEWAAAHAEALSASARADHAGPDDPLIAETSAPAPATRRVARWRSDDSAYAEQVESCRRAIAAGDAYVLCLTDTAEVPGRFDPLEVYAALRAKGPAIRGGVLVAGQRALVTASPERFLSVSGGTVRTHPIKGTRPRGGSPEADAALAIELAADPKERAENLMIVDLMRNDLSRVCTPGTVGVSGFLRVETHPHVHQLVSTVEGTLRPGLSAVDAIAACFPGGSMTGAPKCSATRILASLESRPRGLYSGCFGWIDDAGSAELAMTIRGVELRDEVALVGAGGGITADSVADAEVAEKHLKAVPLLAALRAVD